jgi:hypothetical protein
VSEIVDRVLDKIRPHVEDAVAEETAAAPAAGAEASPEVMAAAESLGRAVAEQFGGGLPVQAVQSGAGSAPAIIELPEEFQKYGGVGVAIIVAPPTEAARAA